MIINPEKAEYLYNDRELNSAVFLKFRIRKKIVGNFRFSAMFTTQ
jgi:hypothetical protein